VSGFGSRIRQLIAFGRARPTSVVVFGRDIEARRFFEPARVIVRGELGEDVPVADVVVVSVANAEGCSEAWLRVALSRAGYAVLVTAAKPLVDTPFGWPVDRVIHHFDDVARLSDERPRQATVLRGDLAQPVLRIDDYPTGVRPIARDLGPLHEVIRQIDAACIRYHLGIVPALLSGEMRQFLRSLRYCVPVVHGYDHAYFEKSALLIDKSDPENARGTVGGFDEFAGQPKREILRKLRSARSILEDACGVTVTGYIPPCNRAGRTTGQALAELGYSHYFSERRIPGCPLSGFTSTFYGRSSDLRGGRLDGPVCFHATWEVDLQKHGDRTSLERALRRLIAERSMRDAAWGAALERRIGPTPIRA
jgi:hypothetical protein